MQPTDVAILHQTADDEASIREAFDRCFDGSKVSLQVATDPEESRTLLESAPVALTFGLTEEQVHTDHCNYFRHGRYDWLFRGLTRPCSPPWRDRITTVRIRPRRRWSGSRRSTRASTVTRWIPSGSGTSR